MDAQARNLSIYSLSTEALAGLDARQAVLAFRDLLWAQARRRSVPITDIHITHEISARDGGVDAAVADTVAAELHDDLLTAGSRFQIKTGGSAPWQPAWVREELFGTKSPGNRAHLGDAVRRCLECNGRYVLVCFGVDPTESQLHQAKENLVAAFAACGF